MGACIPRARGRAGDAPGQRVLRSAPHRRTMTRAIPAARYEAAERLLPHRWKQMVFSGLVRPRWIEEGSRFWYKREGRRGTEFVLVQPESGTRAPAFDHEKIAESLGTALGRELDPWDLPVRGLEFRPGRFLLHVDEQV